MKILNYLPIQWWVAKERPFTQDWNARSWHKTTWWNVIIGKHKGQKLILNRR